jgi:AcrR family transcriptional regulator
VAVVGWIKQELMGPRRYNTEKRRADVEQTRARVIEATRELISAPDGMAGLSMEAVARQAGVARMTVYYQFGSKVGLLEAVYDDLAQRGLVASLRAVFEAPDALEALDELVAAFGRFWASDRLIIRRLRALAALDPVFEGARARDERRRDLFRRTVGRITDEYGRPEPASAGQLVAVLTALASFETFDAIAGEDRSPDDVVPVVQGLARLALGIDAAPSDGR